MEPLKQSITVAYWDDDGNNIGCHIKIYDIVNGREVLNVDKSGPV